MGNGLVGIGGAPVTSFTMSVLNNDKIEIVPTTYSTYKTIYWN